MYNYTRKAYLNIPRFLWDCVFVMVTYPLAIWATRAIHPGLPWVDLMWMPILYAIVFLFSMINKGLYEVTTFTYQDRTLRGVTGSCLFASTLCLVFLLFMPQTRGNADFLAFFSLIGVLLLGIRYFITLGSGQRVSHRSSSQLLLSGEPQQMREYLFYLDKTGFRVNPIGFLSDNPVDAVRGLPRLGKPEDLKSVLQMHVVDEVVLAWPRNSIQQIEQQLHVCTESDLLVKVALDVWEADGTKCHVHSVGPVPVLIYHHMNLSSLQQSAKRGLDVITALLGLLVTIPLAVIIVPAILLSGKGSIMVFIPRHGLNGRLFRQLHFRTTRPGREESSRNPEDQTRAGRFLVRSKLHYLPSFWNVLKGDMSLVGVRGSIQGLSSGKKSSIPLKPGLTGLWHVKDFDHSLDEVGLEQLDNEYAECWNLMLDVRILLLTPLIPIIHSIIGHDDGGEAKA